VQLSAVTRDANNNVLTGRVVTWGSSNTGISTVSGSGLVTAIVAGSATITATSETKTGTAAITVSAPAPVPVASVSVSPASATLVVGGTVQFSAVTRDANNNILTGRVISWGSNNTAIATVSTSGLARAVAAGSVQITATSEGQIGGATLTDTAATPVPPPPSGTSNEPSGMTLISDRPFNALNELGWTDGGGSGQAAIATDVNAPHSPSSVLHAWYPAGYAGGDGPIAMDRSSIGSPRTFYVAFWSKLSANFQGHNSGVNKQFYLYTNNGAPVFYFSAQGVGSGTLTPQIRTQSTVSPSGDANLNPNLVPAAQIVRGQWYLIEVVAVGSTAGNNDGSVDWYMNGVHVGSYTGIRWETGATTWGRMHWTTIWGGVGDTVAAQMDVWWDHIYLSGKN
jgi:hypothetical protein